MHPKRRLAVLAAALLLAGIAFAASSGWQLVSSPNATKANYLYGAAAISPSDIWAVGYEYSSSNVQLTFTERWNGTTWSIVPSPSPGSQSKCGTGYSGSALTGVAAVSANDVWAVGSMCGYESETLTEHWNGAKWVPTSSPNEPGSETSSLVAVAAASTNDVWAVGNYQEGGGAYQWDTLVEHWDGTQWSIVDSPNVAGADKNFLMAVAVVSPTDVWAVGYSETDVTDVPLIEHYDGQGWSVVPSVYPPPSGFNALYSVAALSANDIWAAGYENENSSGQYGGALIEHWDGTSWTLVDAPFLGSAINLYSLAAVSSTDVWAVGDAWNGTFGFDFHPLTEHWSGTRWTAVSAPDPGKAAVLLGAATTSGSVWAVGAYSTTAGIDLQNPRTLTLKR